MVGSVEQALRDALAFADSIVDTIRDPLLVLDADLRVVRASREFYRTFGVASEETQGRRLYDLGNGQWDIPRLRMLLEEILPQNTTFRDFEVEHVFEHIGRKIMLLNARKLYREENASEQILLVIEDVTARRDAEEARREAETRFTEMVKNVRDHSIFLTDPDGIITSWNVAAERVIGYTEAEAVGRHFSLIFTPEDVAVGVPQHELRLAREEGRAEDERWHLRKGGERFWALGIVTALREAGGRLTGYSKVLRDMTERKRAEEALRQSEARFRLMVQSVRDHAIFLMSSSGEVASWNEGCERILGYTETEALGLHGSAFFTEADRQGGAFERELRTAAEAGRALDECWLVRKDGSRLWASGTTTALRDSGGVVRGFSKIFRDLTERRRMEEELRRSHEELEQRVQERTAELVRSQERALQAERLAAIGQTVTALAHEGRNALQRATGCLARLALQFEEQSEERTLVERTGQALDDLERLFSDVRSYAAPIRLESKACDLAQVWREAWRQVVSHQAGRDTRLVEEVGVVGLECEVDAFRLRQVFANLFANALEACPDPVRVTVSCQESLLGDRPALRISVRDNGPGFPAVLRARAFEPFQTTKPTGTGLGMAISKRLIEARGGEITLGQQADGADVVITLPRRPAQSGT